MTAASLRADGIDEKWTSESWKRIERELGSFDIRVLKSLVEEARRTVTNEGVYTVMGEYLYSAVRPVLNAGAVKLLDKLDSRSSTPSSAGSIQLKQGNNRKARGNKGKKGPSKAEQIRMQNSLGTLTTKIEAALATFLETGDEFVRPKLMNDKILELRGVGFLCSSWYLLTKRKTLTWDSELNTLTYSIIVSMQRFIASLSKLKGKSHLDSMKDDFVSPTLVADLSEKLAELKERFKFSGASVYKSAPQLLIFSTFDDTLPISTIKPYPHQRRVCDLFEENLKSGCYIMYRAMTNAGKTTTLISLAATVQRIRERAKADGDDYMAQLEVIFCCNANPVKDQACNWLFNTTKLPNTSFIGFAIAFESMERGREGQLTIRNSWATSSDELRVVTVCSPALALRILKERGRTKPFVLFHDEPTIGADRLDTPGIKQNVNLLRFPPKWTIVSSATLPSEEDLGPFIRRYKNRFQSATVESVHSASITVGCDVYSLEGVTFAPHLGVQTASDLNRCVERISDNMFLSRSYTPPAVSELHRHAKHCLTLPDLDAHFTDIDNLSANAVRKYGLQILGDVSKTPDENVAAVCGQPLETAGRRVDLSKLSTTDAYQFPQMSLIATNQPLNLALEQFSTLLEEVKATKVHTPEKIVAAYWKAQESWSAEIERTRKRKTKTTGMKKKEGKRGDEEGEDGEEVDYAQQEMDLLANKPFISFPEEFQINTRLHAQRYSPTGGLAMERFPLPDFGFITDTKIGVSNDVLLLLCCGVGLYAPTDSRVNSSSYLALVMELAQKGRLAFMIADDHIAYGVNFPFSRTIVCSDFSATHSTNTVYQIISRAGRVGQSWFAEAFVSDQVVGVLQAQCQSDKKLPEMRSEVENILRTARDLFDQDRVEKAAREAALRRTVPT